MIRIIGGRFKGRQVVGVVKDPAVRPITGRMRQSLFDILRPWVAGSRFLDLYAGSGAVGLEALSRGAGHVLFVERDPRCAKGIERNVANMGPEISGEVLRQDILKGLGRLRGRVFDLIFAGPPYKDEVKRPLALTARTQSSVLQGGLLAPKGLLVIQHHKTDVPPVPEGLRLWRRQRYGDSLIDFFRRSDDPAGGAERDVVSVTEAGTDGSSTEEDPSAGGAVAAHGVLTRQGAAVTLMIAQTGDDEEGGKTPGPLYSGPGD